MWYYRQNDLFSIFHCVIEQLLPVACMVWKCYTRYSYCAWPMVRNLEFCISNKYAIIVQDTLIGGLGYIPFLFFSIFFFTSTMQIQHLTNVEFESRINYSWVQIKWLFQLNLLSLYLNKRTIFMLDLVSICMYVWNIFSNLTEFLVVVVVVVLCS